MSRSVLSVTELDDESRLLQRYHNYCNLCDLFYEPFFRLEHLLSVLHQRRYLDLPGMRSMRAGQWCDVCGCIVANEYRLHIDGKKHQGFLSIWSPLHPRLPAKPVPAASRPTYASVAGQPAAPPSARPPAPKHKKSRRTAATSSRPRPASSSSSALTLSADPDGVVDGNLCQLCRVRVGKGRECTAELVATHHRGRQHKTQRAVAQNQWAGEATIAAWQSKAWAQGLSLLPHADAKPLEGGSVVLEVGQACELDLRIKNSSNRCVRLLGVFVVPPLPLPGLSWRQCKQAVIKPLSTTPVPANVTATPAELGSHRALVVACFDTGHNLALPLDISVVPANSRAEVDLLKATSVYEPKPTHIPSVSAINIRVVEGERPPSKVSAKELYTRKLEPFFVPTWLTAAYERSRGRDPDEVTRTLDAPLTASNHASRFRLLLWLEEWQMTCDIRTYDTQAAFSKHPAHHGLFGLTVPGLAEARPSVLTGDRILVSDTSFDLQHSGHAFSGYVWRVEQDWVYLRFHDSFLSHWVSRKPFHVRFSFDRVSMRRAHQGVMVPTAQTVQRFFCPVASPAASPSLSSPTASASTSSGGRYPFLRRWAITCTDDVDECNEWLSNEVFIPDIGTVGLDLEFGLRHGVETIVLVQIATPDACLVYCPPDVTDAYDLPQTLWTLLADGYTKFTIGQQDCDMVEGCWGVETRLDDVQAGLVKLLKLTRKPGLERMVHAFLPELQYTKDKDLQRSTFDWPLSAEQIEYAASDAVLALLLGEKLYELELPECQQLWEAHSKAEALGSPPHTDELKEPTPLVRAAEKDQPLPEVAFFSRELNEPQQQAVRGVCAGEHHPYPYIIFGPPGTGKTTVLIECIRQLLRRNRDGTSRVRILATAPSNSAADLLAERMAAAPVSLSPSAMFRMNAVSRDSRSIPAVLQPFCSIADGQCALRPRAELLRYELVISTCITAATLYALGCEVGDFSHVLVDEAGHATEPEALAAMTGLIDASRTHVILGGDPLQLGPIIRSPLASQRGLGVSMLERLLVDAASLPASPYYRPPGALHPHRYITKLLHNYRSHPAILEQPNALFYKSELIASADRMARESLQRWPDFPTSGFPILMHHVVGREQREGDSPSWWNSDEAMAVVEYVNKLLAYKAGGLAMDDIGIITPYRKQAHKIRQLLSFKHPHTHRLLKVGSVEEYQGQERRVILISTVRSQQLSLDHFDVKYRLGFVHHPKRLNVALTRAKAALVLVGNAHLLREDANWRRYIDFLHAHGAIRGRYQPDRAEAGGGVSAGLAAVAAEMVADTGLGAEELLGLLRNTRVLPGEEKEQHVSEVKQDEIEVQVPASEELPWRRDD